MSVSTIKIVFTEDLPIGAQLGFDVRINNSPRLLLLVFNWVNLRTSSNEVTVGQPSLIPGLRTAINFQTAFNLDFNFYTVTRFNNEVTISSENNSSLVEFFVDPFSENYTNHPSINFEIVNGTFNLFTIDSTIFSNSDSAQSQNIKISATTSELATKIISPFALNGNLENPFSFDWIRGQQINLIVENAEGIRANKVMVLPAALNAANLSLQINNSPNGSTVVVENALSNGLVLEYSLDNVSFQSSNIFNGLVVGNYTLYVKDQFGGAISKTLEITEFGIYTPFTPYISKSNSIRFAKRINFDDASNYKNDENTLASEVEVEVAYSGCQKFKSSNVITTQFKSNYRNNTAKIIKEDLSEVNVPVVKLTNNIGVNDKRDAIKFNLGNGKTGVYFLSGNIYDYFTDEIIDSYSLNGLLPEWAIIGNYININNAWFLIENIVYDEDKQSDVLVYSSNYTGIDIAIVASSIYNDFNYEVYEFTIDMSNYLDQTIQVKLESTDTRFDTVTYISEKIHVKENFDNNLEIRYWNDDNTDVFYASGIKHLINVEITKQEGIVEEESESYKTDTTAILLSAQLYELDKFIFEPVTKEIWRKLMIALSHKNVFINGVQYIKSGSFESDAALDQSNLYVLTATMLKTGEVYNSNSDANDLLNMEKIEVPGLIQTEIGFVKY